MIYKNLTVFLKKKIEKRIRILANFQKIIEFATTKFAKFHTQKKTREGFLDESDSSEEK
jgi:hypothetical protein